MTDLTTKPAPPSALRRRWTNATVAGLPIVLLVAIALSRFPFLDAGYGTNHDAWRVARSARLIADTGQYEVSRFPGYPVHEITCALFRWGGPIALNGLSAAFSVAAAAACWLIARKLKCCDSLLLAVAFAATPTLFINSVSSKDYVWALAFALWALFAILNRRHAIDVVLFGLAIGCRITSGAMLLPLALILYGQTRDWRVIARFAACAGLAALVAFTPVWARYGWSFLTFYDDHARPSVATIAMRATVEFWGSFGVAGLAVAILAAGLAASRTLPRSLPPSENSLLVAALFAWVALYVIAFLALPDQAGYLVPLVAPVLLILARFAARPAFQFACVCLLAAPWIDLGGGQLKQGPVLADHRGRRATLRDVRQFVAMTEEKLPNGTIVVVGAWQPIIDEMFVGTPIDNRYVYLLSRREAEDAARSGVPMAYATEVIRGFNQRVHGVDLAAYGAGNVRQLLLGVP